MIHKLVTLPRGTTKMPIVTANIAKVQLSLGASVAVNPNTLNFQGLANVVESGGYLATIADRRLLVSFEGMGGAAASSTARPFSNSALSETIRGRSFTLTAINSTTLFGNNTKLLTTLTIEGIDSGARVTIPVEISSVVIATSNTQGVTGVVL